MELVVKKSLVHPKRDEYKRTVFKKLLEYYKSENRTIVYVDESGFALDMPRTHGYSPIGKRCYGVCNWNAKGRTNVIGAIIGFSLFTASLFNCNIDSDVFYAWLANDLMPKVKPRSVIVMDNASFHKRKDMIQLIYSKKCIPLFLPPYSPDLNPIEKKWAQVKAHRKKENQAVQNTIKCFLNNE